MVGGIELGEGGCAVAACIAGTRAEAASVEEEPHIGREVRTEVVIVDVAHTAEGFETREDGYLVLSKNIVGVGRLEVDIVTLAVERLLHQFYAS